MLRASPWTVNVSVVAALLAIVVMPCRSANAQEKPFKIVGAGVGPQGLPLPGQPPRSHWAIGEATGLGRYFGEGAVETDTAVFHSDGTITGEFGSGEPFVFEAANGDLLVCEYGRVEFGASQPGTFTLTPVPELGPGYYKAVWVAEFVPQSAECTGKFAGVTGGWIMIARSAPFLLGSSDPVFYSWSGEGSLTFPKEKP